MLQAQKFSLFLLRISLGALFLYAGITKLLDPTWSAAGYISGAKVFTEFYAWLGSATVLPTVNLLNEWGLALIGVSLIVGLFARWSAFAGIVLMALYYVPILSFPYVGEHAYIVDEHIIYIAGLLVIVVFHGGRYWGLDGRMR